MKTSCRVQYGSPEVLSVREVPTPTPGGGELLIRVRAATVNRTDCAILTAKPFLMRFVTGLTQPKLVATGTDFAGDVEAIGGGVTRFKVGDRVWGFDDNGLGSHAEYLVLKDSQAIAVIPARFSYEQAAASIEGAHYALNSINKVSLQPGHRVLVNGATGAIGSAAVQLLRHQGAHVVAVCAAEHAGRVRELGAERVIDYLTEDFTQDAERYDFVFDAVGKSTFALCRPVMKRGAAYVPSELGPGAQNPFLALVGPLLAPFYSGKKVVFPVPVNIERSLTFMHEMIEQGAFTPLIDRSYPLKELREAFTYVASGNKLGNVILTLA